MATEAKKSKSRRKNTSGGDRIKRLKIFAQGRWADFLINQGFPAESLTGKHAPCAKCDGKDRGRFTNRDGDGSYFCNQCCRDAGDGIGAVQWFTGKPFLDVVTDAERFFGIDHKPQAETAPKDPAKNLKFDDSPNELAYQYFGLLRGNAITPDGCRIGGTRLATYRKQFPVVALPVWGSIGGAICGWVIHHAAGGTLPKYQKDKNGDWQYAGEVKVKLTAGSKAKDGIFGTLDRLKTAREVWIVEGFSDLLTMTSFPDLLADVAVISSAAGAKSEPPEWVVQSLAGKQVHIVFDCDTPGQDGAAKWAAATGGMVHTLPYETTKDHGKDLRDYVMEGKTPDGAIVKTFADVAALPTAEQVAQLPEVILPGGAITITSAAAVMGELMGKSGRFYLRGGVPMRAINRDGLFLEPLKPAAACSDFESVARLVNVKIVDGEEETIPAICGESKAKTILEAMAFRDQLPPLTLLSRCPVITERNGRLITITGYDRETGIHAGGEIPIDMSIDDAKKLLLESVADFNFASEGDRSRALAALITPALVFGGLLGGRPPVDVGEADQSQSGKGYRNKITTAIYRDKPRAVTQRERGVGNLQEIFDAALVSGACFPSLENLRGRIETAAIESFLTESTYYARIPYASPVEIDPTKTIVMLTTNKAELTRDMANRSSVVRILKRSDTYSYRIFPEGDIEQHIKANQSRYLGAVFAVVREWFSQGKKRLDNVPHDFKQWGCTLGWIVENILGVAPLLTDHRDIQARVSNPSRNWLRDIALAVKDAGRLGEWLRAHDLLSIALEREIPTSGVSAEVDLDDDDQFGKACRAIGRQISNAMKLEDFLIIEGNLKIEREEKNLEGDHRKKKSYLFSESLPNESDPPNGCPINAQSKSLFAQLPNQLSNLLEMSSSTECNSDINIYGKVSQTIGQLGNCGNSLGGEYAPLGKTDSLGKPGIDCDHINPKAWEARADGKSYCRGCGKYQGRTKVQA